MMARKCKNAWLSLAPLLLTLLSCAGHYEARPEAARINNVIVLVPDGCGTAHMTAARWCKGVPLTQDSMDVSLIRTHCVNSMITGSAAAATAFATGFKSWEDPDKAACLSMRPDSILFPEPRPLPISEQWRPSATVLEGARLSGKAVGLVATCRVNHATPAAFASHWHSRDANNIIMEQMVYQGVDVVFGGGFRYLVSAQEAIPGSRVRGTRRDGEDLHGVLRARGYAFITTRGELDVLDAETRKVWGLFANNHMAYDIDRAALAPDEPSLAEMTRKAIEILDHDPDGFFLLVEGSQVDWASHDNDPVGMITDYLAFDRAVEVALDFARSNAMERTLVLVFPDHECGGMTLGNQDIDAYSFRPEQMVSVINKARLSAEGVAILLRNLGGDGDAAGIREVMVRYCGIDDLNDRELTLIQQELADSVDGYLNPVLGTMVSRRCGIGWTTGDHTGTDVPMFSYGFRNVPQTIDNTEIAHLCASAMGFDLDAVTGRLFAEAGSLFGDGVVTIDTTGVINSAGQLIVERDGKKAYFPFFKNVMVTERDTFLLEGLTVYSLKAHKVYLPRQAKTLFDAVE